MPTTNGWLDELDLSTTLKVLDDLSTQHALQGGAVGLQILELIRQKDYAGLCDFDLGLDNPGWDVFHLLHCRQALGFYTKLEDLEIGIDKKASAVVTFEKSERLCKSTNELFRAYARGKVCFLPHVVKALFGAQRKIARVLGPAPVIDELNLTFGPGATTSIKKRSANPQSKLAETPSCSDELLRSPYLPSLLRSVPHWLDCHEERVYVDEDGYEVSVINVQVAVGCVEFVPKSAKTYRIIDKQPTLNTLLQGGIGRYLARKLRSAGIAISDEAVRARIAANGWEAGFNQLVMLNISDQTVNQRLAREGSLTGDLATLDLSNASDTISKELVRFLLPDDWYSLLYSASCGVTAVNGQPLVLQKFCSMGNGFTFPLETLIFWALTSSACSGDVSKVNAYGDDIICPSSQAENVCSVLTACGFVVNSAKSYVTGPFRESCGRDFYLGTNIRPYYQKHLVSGETLFTLHNFYVRNFMHDEALRVLSYIPEPLRMYGPDGYGDGHLLHSEWPSFRTREAKRRGYGGWYFSTYRHVGCVIPNLYPGDYVTPLYSIYTRAEGTLLEPADSELRYDNFGRPLWPAPGFEGYEKKLVYTFTPF